MTIEPAPTDTEVTPQPPSTDDSTSAQAEPDPTPPGDPADVQEDEGDLDGLNQADPLAKLRKEAARHRTRLREVEAERDSLAERVEAMRVQRACEIASAAGLSEGSDLFGIHGAALADLLDEHGDVDPEAVKAAAKEALAARPGLGQRAWPDMGSDLGSPPIGPSRTTAASVLSTNPAVRGH